MKSIFKQTTIFSLVKMKYQIINILCSIFPKKKMIILESHPDLSCNTYELFRHMLDKHINKEYAIVWMVNDPYKYYSIKSDNVFYKEIYPKGILNKIKHYIFCNRAAAVITSNRIFFPKICGNKTQLNVFMDHGSPLKDVTKDGGRFKVDCDYIISQSEFFNKSLVDQYTITEDQIIVTGLPRNDQLYNKYDSIRKLYNDIDLFEKVILWAPTFRHHMRKERIDCDFDLPLGIPIFYSADRLKKFNNFLKEKGVLLILKPHPAQDMDLIMDLNLSNIRILINEQLEKNSIQTNELLVQTDALITDYSSIYYDYLLLGRPIAITLDDYDAYKNQMGFVFDKPLDVLVGMHVHSEDELYEFVQATVSNMDIYSKERACMIEKIDYYHDNQASSRVLTFILNELKNRSMVKGRL